MNVENSLFETQINGLKQISAGKVRNIFELDDQRLLIVTSDRISAFDVVLPTPVPEKGSVLTSVSCFWFEKTRSIIKNHLISTDISVLPLSDDEKTQLEGRCMVVKKLKPLPVEAIVRGYIVGSGWKDYQKSGRVCGIELPSGLSLADKLEAPLYTPSTKADMGDHDENIDFEKTIDLLGEDLATQVKNVSLELYCYARDFAAKKGIIIADTKFEFGLDDANQLYLIDEALTPDSSRFWPMDQYQPGVSPPSFDKQYIRDYLETLDWNKQAPGPELPDDIIENTCKKYKEAESQLIDG
ncbi:MAG: phosphoribosylaminoimidazolesuccinocarboxamide synthase [Methylococcales bacterium]|nr:phosphoribosylaminoimidazolesuccinocarboxamide synthase [Methylococcales bacterium]